MAVGDIINLGIGDPASVEVFILVGLGDSAAPSGGIERASSYRWRYRVGNIQSLSILISTLLHVGTICLFVITQ